MDGRWLVIAALVVITVAIKATGPLLLSTGGPPRRATAVLALVAPAVLAALVIYETFGVAPAGARMDGRALGLGVAAIASALRLPMLAVVVLAAVATALGRTL